MNFISFYFSISLIYLFFLSVCREWLVHEDGALAYRLQDEESMYLIEIIMALFTVCVIFNMGDM